MIIKKVAGNLIRIFLILSSIALIGAAAAPFIDPQTFQWTAFLGLMYPFLLVLHLVAFVVYILFKRNKRTLFFLIPVLLTADIFLNSFGLNFFQSSTKQQEKSLKFMTYNVHMFKDANDLNSNVQPAILQVIKDERPEILCTQDFQANINGKENTIDSLKNILNAQYVYNGPNNPKLFPTQSISTFSKYPIINTGYIVLSETSPSNEAIFTDINKNGKIVRVYNVHFESLGFKPFQYEEWKDADLIGKFEFLFKVKDKFSAAFANRSAQVKMLKANADSCPYPYIIAGDFNDTPSSYAVHYIMKGLKNTFREKGKGYKVTFNGGLPDFQIDYVFVKPSFNVLDYKVIHKRLSDHYPVVVNLAVQ